jgi:hypothetical protein
MRTQSPANKEKWTALKLTLASNLSTDCRRTCDPSMTSDIGQNKGNKGKYFLPLCNCCCLNLRDEFSDKQSTVDGIVFWWRYVFQSLERPTHTLT